MPDTIRCLLGLGLIGAVAVALWYALAYMSDNAPEPHDEVKGGFAKEVREYSGPHGIMEAAALAESHRSGRERWRTGTVVLRDNDMGDFFVSVNAQWLVDNERNFPRWGIRIDNRLSDSPRNVNNRLFDEAHKNFRKIPSYPPDERGYPVKIDKHERTRR